MYTTTHPQVWYDEVDRLTKEFFGMSTEQFAADGHLLSGALPVVALTPDEVKLAEKQPWDSNFGSNSLHKEVKKILAQESLTKDDLNTLVKYGSKRIWALYFYNRKFLSRDYLKSDLHRIAYALEALGKFEEARRFSYMRLAIFMDAQLRIDFHGKFPDSQYVVCSAFAIAFADVCRIERRLGNYEKVFSMLSFMGELRLGTPPEKFFDEHLRRVYLNNDKEELAALSANDGQEWFAKLSNPQLFDQLKDVHLRHAFRAEMEELLDS